MAIYRRYVSCVYPSKKQQKLLNEHLLISVELWNNLLTHVKYFYKNTNKFPNRRDPEFINITKNSGIYAQTAREVAHRLHDSLLLIGKLRKQGIKIGFPRFKTRNNMRSLCYPQTRQGFKLIDNKLIVTPFGLISIKLHRAINGKIKRLILKQQPSGKWFACFIVEQENKSFMPNNKEQVGIDLGLKTFATLSDGTKINNPLFYKTKEKQRTRLKTKFFRQQKQSKNNLKTQLSIVRLEEKIRNKKIDFLHKESDKLTKNYSLIAIEQIKIRKLAEQNRHSCYNKALFNASWNMFTNMLSYKAASAGSKVILVNPKNTTNMCNKCKTVGVDIPIKERIFNCNYCGHIEDRDINAAKNILALAIATVGTTEGKASEDGMHFSSMKEETR